MYQNIYQHTKTKYLNHQNSEDTVKKVISLTHGLRSPDSANLLNILSRKDNFYKLYNQLMNMIMDTRNIRDNEIDEIRKDYDLIISDDSYLEYEESVQSVELQLRGVNKELKTSTKILAYGPNGLFLKFKKQYIESKLKLHPGKKKMLLKSFDDMVDLYFVKNISVQQNKYRFQQHFKNGHLKNYYLTTKIEHAFANIFNEKVRGIYQQCYQEHHQLVGESDDLKIELYNLNKPFINTLEQLDDLKDEYNEWSGVSSILQTNNIMYNVSEKVIDFTFKLNHLKSSSITDNYAIGIILYDVVCAINNISTPSQDFKTMKHVVLKYISKFYKKSIFGKIKDTEYSDMKIKISNLYKTDY